MEDLDSSGFGMIGALGSMRVKNYLWESEVFFVQAALDRCKDVTTCDSLRLLVRVDGGCLFIILQCTLYFYFSSTLVHFGLKLMRILCIFGF